MPIVTHVRGPVIPGSAQRIFIAAPTTEKYDPPFVGALFAAVSALSAAGIQADLCMEVGNCHVDDARNSLVRQFLMTDCTDLIFIDADVGFCAEDLVKLARFERDVVAGVYPKKQDEEEFPVATLPGVDLWSEPDGCVVKGIIGAPTGFMRIRRHVLETMVETFKPRSFAGSGSKPGDPLYTVIFEREIANGKRYSGDYNFCRRWIALGGEIAVDPRMTFAHEGRKQWIGDLASFWRRKHGVTAQAFDQAIESIKRDQVTPDTLAALVEGWGNERYSADPLLLASARIMAKSAKGPILETGSGLTTLLLALTRPDLEVHAIEHDGFWAEKTRAALAKYGVTNAQVHVSPLAKWPAGGIWYDTTPPALAWGLILNDGPPRTLADRSMLYRLMGDQFGDAPILMDDAHDPSQLTALTQWANARGRSVRSVTEDDGLSGVAICEPMELEQAA